MDLLTKAKSIGSGGCESDGIEEEENFSQDSGEGADNDTDSKRAKGFGRRQRRKCFSVFVKREEGATTGRCWLPPAGHPHEAGEQQIVRAAGVGRRPGPPCPRGEPCPPRQSSPTYPARSVQGAGVGNDTAELSDCCAGTGQRTRNI